MVYSNRRKKKRVYLLAKYKLPITSQPSGIPTNKQRSREIILFLEENGEFSIGIRYKDYQKISMIYSRTRGGIGMYGDIFADAEIKAEEMAKWKWEFRAPFVLDDDDKIYREYWTGGSLKVRFTLAHFNHGYHFRYSGDFIQSSKYGGISPMKVKTGTIMTDLELKLVKAKSQKVKKELYGN